MPVLGDLVDGIACAKPPLKTIKMLFKLTNTPEVKKMVLIVLMMFEGY